MRRRAGGLSSLAFSLFAPMSGTRSKQESVMFNSAALHAPAWRRSSGKRGRPRPVVFSSSSPTKRSRISGGLMHMRSILVCIVFIQTLLWCMPSQAVTASASTHPSTPRAAHARHVEELVRQGFSMRAHSSLTQTARCTRAHSHCGLPRTISTSIFSTPRSRVFAGDTALIPTCLGASFLPRPVRSSWMDRPSRFRIGI